MWEERGSAHLSQGLLEHAGTGRPILPEPPKYCKFVSERSPQTPPNDNSSICENLDKRVIMARINRNPERPSTLICDGGAEGTPTGGRLFDNRRLHPGLPNLNRGAIGGRLAKNQRGSR